MGQAIKVKLWELDVVDLNYGPAQKWALWNSHFMAITTTTAKLPIQVHLQTYD